MKFNNVVVLFFLLLLQVNTSIASTSSDEVSKRVDAVVDFHGIIPSNFSEPLGMQSCFVAHEYTVPSTEPKTSKLHQREPYIYFNVVHSSVNGSDPERRIYFPKNGVQPTADEAVAYSLADIQDGRITEWYMRMFGWSDAGGAQLMFGFASPKDKLSQKQPSPIIKIAPNNCNPSSFWNVFRVIADNPIGRVLLYRIILEIRKCYCFSNGEVSNEKIRSYNKMLFVESSTTVTIAYRAAGSFSVFGENAAIAMSNTTSGSITSSCIGSSFGENSVAIVPSAGPFSIALFRELCHWFHFLLNPERYLTERLSASGTVMLDGRIDGPDRSLKIPLGNLYWPREKSVTDKQWRERLSVSAIPWLIAMSRQKEVVNFEEVRTILGSSATSPDFQNGDDLSENLYRYSLGYPLRFGHRSSIAYYEDASVVRRAVSCCQVAALNHGILPPQIIATGIVPPHITLGDALYGIGGCVHSKSIVESAK